MIPDINLLKKDGRETHKKGNFAKLFLILLTLAIIIFYGINYYLLHRDVADIQEKSDRLATQIELQNKELEELQQTPKGQLVQAIDFAGKEQISVGKITDVANKNLDGSGELAGFDYNYDQAQIAVYFDDLSEAATYVKKMKKESIFKTVELTSTAAFTEVDVQNVSDETDLEGDSRYKAIIQVTLNLKKLESGGAK